MNLIDNGIQKVIEIKRVITETEMYFEVTFIDWYNRTQTKRFTTIENLENKRWME